MAETLEDALAAEEMRAVRDMFREGYWLRLVEVELLDENPDADPDRREAWQDRVFDAVRLAPLEPPRPLQSSRAADVARLLLLAIIIATALALVWAAPGGWP